ncbi:MAG: hypothetical protein IJ794_02275, partial [Lachnospiraceae bacterium]|nr:hypothetical protein [Lachnospiraceae bacterium]
MEVRLNHRIRAAEALLCFCRIIVWVRAGSCSGNSGTKAWISKTGGQKMDEKTRDMMDKILESDRIGYAYFYPLAGG